MDIKRFNALAGYSRSPAAAYFSREIDWYANREETIIGVVLQDIMDDDYAAVVLGRDEGGRFRAFDIQAGFTNTKEATDWLISAIRWHSASGKNNFPQGDSGKSIELFSPIVPPERQHPYFVVLNSDSAFLSAKAIINEMMPHFIDIDGNFVEQFQSTGFDSRLWELYLFAYLTEEQIFINREYARPDFLVEKYGKKVGIEGVIVGRRESNPPKIFKESSGPKFPPKHIEEIEHVMPIKFGSSLYSKLQKKYWELPHVRGNPIVFAIADFHDDFSMVWSFPALVTYLYGYKHDFQYDEKNRLVITPLKVHSHKIGGKEIPSGFFFQPDTENVSAILFSSSGTISKFNRLGRQAGFGDPNIRMFRQGTCHDHDPNASVPKIFRYEVDQHTQETWGEGLSMYHNPNALYPVPQDLFPSIAHHHFREGQIVSKLPDFFPYASFTYNFRFKK